MSLGFNLGPICLPAQATDGIKQCAGIIDGPHPVGCHTLIDLPFDVLYTPPRGAFLSSLLCRANEVQVSELPSRSALVHDDIVCHTAPIPLSRSPFPFPTIKVKIDLLTMDGGPD
jgi:hypothetical protein